jgi:hypothetical protein
MIQAVFGGLVFNEADEACEVAQFAGESHYVVNDDGFRRHVPSTEIDKAVLRAMRDATLANKDAVTIGAMKMMGKDDLFTKAMIDSSLRNIDDHLDKLLETGLPEGARQWLGLLGLKIIVNHHGEVIDIQQPMGYGSDDE